MIFTIQTDDEVAGLDIFNALNNAGIQHTILSKLHDNPENKEQMAVRALLENVAWLKKAGAFGPETKGTDKP
jgi:hypothetical protein